MPSTSPLISVIVPNFNGARFLEPALRSIQRQSYREIEVLVVDDCSTDDSPQIAEAFARGDARFHLLSNTENQGVSAVRAKGVAASRGQFLTTLDNDDVLLDPRKLEKEMQLIGRAADVDGVVAFSGIRLIDVNGRETGKTLHRRNAAQGRVFEKLLTRSVPIPRDMTYSRFLYDRVGGFDPAIALYEDWDLKLRLARVAEYRFSGSAGVGYRRAGTGLSSDKAGCAEWLERVFWKNAAGLTDADDALSQLRNNMNRPRRRWLHRLANTVLDALR